jgi:hypothetical protein
VCEGVGEPYIGPSILGVKARSTRDPAKRRDSLVRAEALLAQGCVSHAYFHFYDIAIETSLEHGEWEEVLRYAQALADYTRDEPVPWADLVVRRGRALARHAAGGRDAGLPGELEGVANAVREAGYHAFAPRLDAALSR